MNIRRRIDRAAEAIEPPMPAAPTLGPEYLAWREAVVTLPEPELERWRESARAMLAKRGLRG